MKQIWEVFPMRPRHPITATAICEAVASRSKQLEGVADIEPLSRGTLGAITGILNRIVGNDKRKNILMLLFGVDSSSKLARESEWALFLWVYPHTTDSCPPWCKNIDDTWHAHPSVALEAHALHNAFMASQGWRIEATGTDLRVDKHPPKGNLAGTARRVGAGEEQIMKELGYD